MLNGQKSDQRSTELKLKIKQLEFKLVLSKDIYIRMIYILFVLSCYLDVMCFLCFLNATEISGTYQGSSFEGNVTGYCLPLHVFASEPKHHDIPNGIQFGIHATDSSIGGAIDLIGVITSSGRGFRLCISLGTNRNKPQLL